MQPSTAITVRSTFEQDYHGVMERVRAEYREMPGLCLNLAQAARLLGVDRTDCARILKTLLDAGYLRLTQRGHYVLAE